MEILVRKEIDLKTDSADLLVFPEIHLISSLLSKGSIGKPELLD